MTKKAKKILCKIGFHNNVFIGDYEENLGRMIAISDDLMPPFKKHYEPVLYGTFITCLECKRCGKVKITIYGRVKQK